jgi:hypothetical protein
MLGTYKAASVLADSALEILKRAYDERQSADVGALILSAQESITHLKQAIIHSRSYDDLSYDPYELSENNSAV